MIVKNELVKSLGKMLMGGFFRHPELRNLQTEQVEVIPRLPIKCGEYDTDKIKNCTVKTKGLIIDFKDGWVWLLEK